MSNWDDWVYFGGDDENKAEKLPILKFCLNCGKDRNIRGARYRVVGSIDPAILVDSSSGFDCKLCKFPIFTSSQYKRIRMFG